VVCDFTIGTGLGGASWQVLTGARLMDVEDGVNATETEVMVVDPGSPLAVGVAASYWAPNGSSSYVTTSDGVVVADAVGAPVVIHRLFTARGGADFYALPYDFYEWDAAAAALLHRAVTYGFAAEPAVGVVRQCVDTVDPVSDTNPVPSSAGEYYATIAALEHAGLAPAHVVEIADAADAVARYGQYDVLLFPEEELCTLASGEWVGPIENLLAIEGRVVALGWTSTFVNGLGLFGTGSTTYPSSSEFSVAADPFWIGISHPGYLNATEGWIWSGVGLQVLGYVTADPTTYTVWGYDVD